MAATMNSLRDRWDRITPRERTLIVALGGLAILAIIVFAARTVSSGLDRIEARNEALRASLLEMQAYAARKNVQSAAPQVELPDKPEQLATYLEEIAKRLEIEIPAFQPQSPVTRGDHVERSMKIEVRGMSLGNLKDFLQQIESRSRTVVVSRLSIKRNFRDKEKLNVEMTVTTYAKKPEDKPADADKEG